jgi:hypothetical protein
MPMAEKHPPFLCFRTADDDPNRRIKCWWNEQEQKYNRDCQVVDVSECMESHMTHEVFKGKLD